jgi:hypothetical protein
LQAIGPTPSSSLQIFFLSAGACKLPSCQRATWFPQYIRAMPRLVD